MAEIFPFRAAHYNLEKIKRLGDVIAPPYDQIPESMQEKLYARHPYNFVRLILGKTSSGDTETGNRYTRAAADLSAWLQEKILVQEETPSLFSYEQNFSLPDGKSYSRVGIAGILRLELLGKNVLPHEKTFPKPKQDRLQLMRTCRADFEPVFFLTDDPENQMRGLFSSVRLQEPFASCRDDAGARHALWKISQKEPIQKIQSFLANRPLLIADGHHRYETSLVYEKEREQENPELEAPYHFRLGVFVSLHDPGLVILPTHRVLQDLSEEEKSRLKNGGNEFFSMESVSSVQTMLQEIKKRKKGVGLMMQNQCWILQWRCPMDRPEPLPVRNLDVFRLHYLILERTLGIPEKKWPERIEYVRRPEEAIGKVQSNFHAAAFFLNPVSAADVMSISQAGAVMPQKSTDFYPKLASGLFFYLLDVP